MPYATVEDLKLRFGRDVNEALDRDADGQDDTGLADAVLQDASSEIDAIIGVRYPVPVNGCPWLLVACCDLARYRLYDDAAPESVKERRESVLTTLRSIRDGRADLIGAEGQAIKDKAASGKLSGGATSVAPRDRIFTDQGLAGYMGE